MSKKDFIALADALRRVPGLTQKNTGFAHRYVDGQKVLEAIADVCAADNPRFKRDRWFAYIRGECGPSGRKV